MIDCTRPFCCYALCEVDYNGRAVSHVGLGNRLIINKSDSSFVIHKATCITPMNYNGPKSSLVVNGDKLISTSKSGEIITVTIKEILSYTELDCWSNKTIDIKKTESDLCDKIIDNAGQLLGINVKSIEREMPTVLGKIDIVCTDMDNIKHCIEVKRKTISVSGVYQLNKYMKYMSKNGSCVGYMAAPKISSNAMMELMQFGYQFIKIDF